MRWGTLPAAAWAQGIFLGGLRGNAVMEGSVCRYEAGRELSPGSSRPLWLRIPALPSAQALVLLVSLFLHSSATGH